MAARKAPGSDRPRPPASVFDDMEGSFVPDYDLVQWLKRTFIAEDGPLFNPDHHHLDSATIGALWTNVPNARGGRRVVGTCERGNPMAMGRWAKAKAEMQVRHWFGAVPHFILTFDAEHALACDDAEFCALVEHELYHAAQETDEYGAPKFRQDGSPAFTIRGHDIEEFVGVVRRYGAETAGVSALIEAAKGKPEVAQIRISQACGTCLLKAA